MIWTRLAVAAPQKARRGQMSAASFFAPNNTGFMIAAPSSGAGKTTLTLAILRALARKSPVRGAKCGPDYIDPQFHSAATGRTCLNLDGWAMTDTCLMARAQSDPAPLIIEGAMGLFDGELPYAKGSAARVAKTLGLPVVLIVDAAKTAQSVAAVVRGMMFHDPDVQIAAVILNRVGSDKHRRMIESAWADLPPIIGAVPRSGQLSHPSRHLGLVQADERADLIEWLDALADTAEAHIELSALPFVRLGESPQAAAKTIWPPAQRIAIAQDEAFRFVYPHMLQEWHAAGAQITPFSPLRNDPVPEVDFVFLPGGYPELYAGRIAANSTFINSLKNTSQKTDIYGECGGYMLLGAGLIDADGTRHQMAGLLDLETSFKHRKLHLGYRSLTPLAPQTTGLFANNNATAVPAHEFHYASTLRANGTPLFAAKDSEGASLSHMGLIEGRVRGSFAHIIEFNS